MVVTGNQRDRSAFHNTILAENVVGHDAVFTKAARGCPLRQRMAAVFLAPQHLLYEIVSQPFLFEGLPQ